MAVSDQDVPSIKEIKESVTICEFDHSFESSGIEFFWLKFFQFSNGRLFLTFDVCLTEKRVIIQTEQGTNNTCR